MTTVNAELRQDNIFTDKKSGKQFRLFKYFDHEVIQDVETGWINAGRFVRDVGGSLGKDMDLYDFKTNEDYQLCIEYMNDHYPSEEIRIYKRLW